MHDSVMRWVTGVVRAHGLAPKRTLEVGSLNVNGSVRALFTGEYTGVDMRPGKGVDKVMDAHDLAWPDAAFEVVVSTEMLEHDAEFWVSLAEMGRILEPGGHLIVTTRGNGFAEHGFPFDYWRFMPASGPLLLAMAGCERVTIAPDPQTPGIFLHGVRR